MRNLSQGKILATTVPLPPEDEQREIAKRVNEYLALADSLLVHIDTSKRRIARSSQAILAKAFRGDLLTSLESVRDL